MTRRLTLWLPIVFLLCGRANAEIITSLWTFRDDAFADFATQIDAGVIAPVNAPDLQGALTGYSPTTYLRNIGSITNFNHANHFQLDFTDTQAVNGAGPDIAFFTSQFIPEPYEIAVRPKGEPFTAFRTYNFLQFQAVIVQPQGFQLGAAGIDIDDYGFPRGTVVDAIQFRGLPGPLACQRSSCDPQGDPRMAGVISQPIVTVLFSGFGGGLFDSGMDTLNTRLQETFAKSTHSFASRVFLHTKEQEALDWIESIGGHSCLVIGGHSFGGDSAIGLAEDFVFPDPVDLTIQIDSVGVGDEVLPSNVRKGVNYYQISTGLLEPQGAMFVSGAENINFEAKYGTNSDGTPMTHFSIDDDHRLHDQIATRIANECSIDEINEDTVVEIIAGSLVSLSQTVDVPTTPFDLTFDYQFETTGGELSVLLDGVILGSILAPGTLETGFLTASFPVGGALLGQAGVDLNFALDGPHGSTLLLDSIDFPGLVDGDFEQGDLAAWTTTLSGNGSINALTLVTPIPEPSTLTLAGLGLLGLLAYGWRRSRRA